MTSFNEVIFNILTKNKLTLSTAESVTGGMLASTIIGNEGASKIFKGGVVSYTNEIKEKILNVRKYTLEKYGAVSPQTAREMAEGVAKLFQTPISVSITGIASGSVEGKPCGLAYFCILISDIYYEHEIRTNNDDRNENRIMMTSRIISELARTLQKMDK